MTSFWHALGVIRWPLAFSMLAVCGLTVFSAIRLYGPRAVADLRTKAWLDAILFWGGFALVTGVLGTLVGIILAAQAIEAVGEVQPALVWGGIKVALLSAAAGSAILAFAGIGWFALQMRWRLMAADAA